MAVKEILADIINAFNPEKFDLFLREKSRNYRPIGENLNQYNIAPFADGVRSGEMILSDDNEFIVCTFKINKTLNERSGKKDQYSLGKKILKDYQRYAGGFFIFYDEKGDFRFSLIHDIPQPDGKRDWSNFRRYTYFVSQDQTNKTFLQRMAEADFSTLDNIIEAFSVEKVTKQFYQEIANWYFWAQEGDKIKYPDDFKYNDDPVKDKEQRNALNLIRLITRIIFIWFLRQKKLINPDLFDKNALQSTVRNFMISRNASNYYNAILQNLFFATLNQKIEEREFATEGQIEDNRAQYGVKNLFRYAGKFLINRQQVLKLFGDIPFLNGGLFDCLDKPDDKGTVVYIDGFSRNPHKQAVLPDYLFFLEDETPVNLTGFGLPGKRRVRGLFEILNSYNFTIDENTPVDQEVALDPELLGKVFENLLASYNPETATTARKATGSYYTPRPIVDYMVEQSLKECLKTKLSAEIENFESRLNDLFSYDSEHNPFSTEESRKIISAIHGLKILDPACGSGAFPMGILHRLVQVLHKLDPENKEWYEIQYHKAIAETEEAFRIGNKAEREIRLQEINEVFDQNINEPDYARKLYLIENCIYGVDIQPIAVQIAKLRFFISLVIDQKVDKTKPNFGVLSLPNLETKFVAANTLIPLRKTGQMTFKNPDVQKKEDELKTVRHKYFEAKTRSEKLGYQRQDKKVREELADLLVKHGWDIESAQQIAKHDLYDQNIHAEWFDPEWMFGRVEGFDIVIGNPPYIQLQKNHGALAELYKNKGYQTFDRMGDIYTLFYEKGLQILKERSFLCFITSNKWMRAGYGEKLRGFFTSYNPRILADLGPGIFESATVDTNILLIQKQPNLQQLRAVTIDQQNNEPVNIGAQVKERGVALPNLSKDAWFIGSSAEQRLKEKIDRIGKPLKDWDLNIYYGIKTGLNEAFIITTEKREEILKNCKDVAERQSTEAIIKPILRGRDIKRYYYEWAGLWVIVIPAGWTNEHRGKENPEMFIRNQVPSLMEYLESFEEKAKKRDDKGDYWWELRHCAYYPEFEKEKIIYPNMTKFLPFVYDDKHFFTNQKCFILLGENGKYLNGYFNSAISHKWIRDNCPELQGGTRELSYIFFQNIPLPPITHENADVVRQIEELVDKILAEKKENPQADTSELERVIDRLVYELYGLTEEEIAVVESV